MNSTINKVSVICNDASQRKAAVKLSMALMAPLLINIEPKSFSTTNFIALVDQNGISLLQTGDLAPGPIKVEFLSGAVDHRRKFGGGKGQIIAKAVGIQANVHPFVLDATAGLGRDAFVLASLGCKVDMLERSVLIHALLEDGLRRANRNAADVELKHILSDMFLHNCDAHEYLTKNVFSTKPDVVYLDPMFPERHKSADVKKDMKVFHALVGKDLDADELLDKARVLAKYRVVVKRPRKAPYLNDKKPNIEFSGKSSRFDVYTNKKMPTVLPNHP